MKGKHGPINFDSPREITAYLKERGIALKKRWGQNFMINRAARQKILSLLDLQPSESVWEVGPGLGAMTVELAESAGRLTLFEIDWALIHHLEEIFAAQTHVKIVSGDVLDTWYEVYRTDGVPDALFGNLPYRSASMLIGTLLERGVVPARIVCTVQKEVALRMAAHPGTSDYSGMSVLCQAYCTVDIAGDLQAGSFFPPPEVVSSVVHLRRSDNAPIVSDPVSFARLVRASFSARRKTLHNNLFAGALSDKIGKEQILQALKEEGIPLNERAEQLSPRTFASLADRLSTIA